MGGRRIKILRIIGRLNIGGPAIQAITLTKRLNNESFESKLITGVVPKGEGDMSFLADGLNVDIIKIPEMSRNISPIKDLITIWKIFKILRRFKPDIVHTHTAKAGFAGRLSAVIAGVPIRIHTFHGHILSEYFSRFKSIFFLWIERILAFFTDKIIAVSVQQKKELTNRFKITNREKCVVVPLGLDVEKYLRLDYSDKPRQKRRLGYNTNDLVVAIVGRLTKVKNHRLFLEMAKFIVEKGRKNIQFAIIGDGELREELSRYAQQLGIAEKVRFFGWQKEMENIYPAVDVLSLTSLNEGTPVAVIEAMASAIPIVATGVGGVPDLVRDGQDGYIVTNFDPDVFSDKVILILDDKDKRLAMGYNGREYVREKHNEEALINNISNLYTDLVIKKGVKL